MQSPKVIWFALLLVMLSVGCGGGSSFRGGGHEVSGTVTVDGKPLEYGTAEFQSLDSKTFVRRAVITSGKFSLQGPSVLPVGGYSVRVVPYEPEVEELGQVTEEVRRKINASRDLIPAKYQQHNALGVKVANGSKNAFKLDLQTAGAAPQK